MRSEPSMPGRGGPGWLHDETVIAWRLLIVTGAALLAVWLVLQVTVIAVAVFLAFAQAALLWPLVQRLTRFFPRPVASLLLVAVYAAAVLALTWFILRQLVNAAPQLVSALLGSLEAANDWFLSHGWALPPEVVDNLLGQLQARVGQLATGIGGAALSTLSTLTSAGAVIVLALFATLFALIGGEKMTQGIVGLVPAQRQLSTFAAIRDAATTARWWMFASTVTGAVDGIFIGLGMHFLGVPLAVPIGLATFILGFIPMIGATIAGAMAVGVALFFGGISTALWTLVLVLAVQQIEGNVLSPLLLSRAMQFPPLLTLLLSTTGGVALGLPGLFLAVPVAGILTAALRAWRRELPEDVRTAKGIGRNPKPSFDELSERAAPRESEDVEQDEDEQAEEEHPGGEHGASERGGAHAARARRHTLVPPASAPTDGTS